MIVLTEYVDDLILWCRTEQRNYLLQESASKGHKVSKEELLTDSQKKGNPGFLASQNKAAAKRDFPGGSVVQILPTIVGDRGLVVVLQ